MIRCHLVHGILDPVGRSGLLGLIPYLERAGFDVRVPDYGLITACETKIVNPLLRRALHPYMEPGDLWIGHSNGCAIGYELSVGVEELAPVPFAGCVWINPALERNRKPLAPCWTDCYYNAGDEATVAAVAAASLGLADSVWGEMGHAGPEPDPSGLVVGIDCGATPDLPPVSGHGDIFTPAKLAAWAPFIVERIRSRLAMPAA